MKANDSKNVKIGIWRKYATTMKFGICVCCVCGIVWFFSEQDEIIWRDEQKVIYFLKRLHTFQTICTKQI